MKLHIHQIINPYIHLFTVSAQLSSHKTQSHYLLPLHKPLNFSSQLPLSHYEIKFSHPIANSIQSSAHSSLHLASHSTTNQSVNGTITSYPQPPICPSNHTLSHPTVSRQTVHSHTNSPIKQFLHLSKHSVFDPFHHLSVNPANKPLVILSIHASPITHPSDHQCITTHTAVAWLLFHPTSDNLIL
jgi:hypothetical protein